MTPSQLAKAGSESANQMAFFAYCAFAMNHGFEKANLWAAMKPFSHLESKAVPELRWIHASGNGAMMGDSAKTRAMRANRMKAEGLTPGVSDIFWPYKVERERWFAMSGLYIEMKKPTEKPKREGSKGGVSSEQQEFIDYVISQNYVAKVCYSWEEAVQVLIKYYYGVY